MCKFVCVLSIVVSCCVFLPGTWRISLSGCCSLWLTSVTSPSIVLTMATIWLPLLLLELSTLPYGSYGALRYKQLTQHIRLYLPLLSLAFSWSAICVEVCTSSHLYVLLSTPWGKFLSITSMKTSNKTWWLIFLQLLDFPPILWIFDAHSLWHLSTIPLPLFWYRYVRMW